MSEHDNDHVEFIRNSAIKALKEGSLQKAASLLAPLMPDVACRPSTNIRVQRRTRFIIKYAVKHSIRLSALLLLIAAHTRRKYRAGKQGHSAAWHHTTEWFAKSIGVGPKQLSRLLRAGRASKLLDWTRTGRGLLVWLTDQSVYAELAKDGQIDETVVGYYYPRMASVLGLNGSMIYSLLKEPNNEGDRRRVNSKRVVSCLPWLTEETARKELEVLYQRGAVQRELNHRLSGQTGYCYFYEKCRQKHTAFPIKSEGGENVQSVEKMSNQVEKMSNQVEKMSERKSHRYALGRQNTRYARILASAAAQLSPKGTPRVPFGNRVDRSAFAFGYPEAPCS